MRYTIQCSSVLFSFLWERIPYMTMGTDTDSRTGEKKCLVMRDLVFVNWRTGEPAKNSSYDTHLYKLCDEAGIKRFCMHALRHPYVKHTTKKYNSEKQKTQATKMDLIAWGFCFCIVSYSKRSWTL